MAEEEKTDVTVPAGSEEEKADIVMKSLTGESSEKPAGEAEKPEEGAKVEEPEKVTEPEKKVEPEKVEVTPEETSAAAVQKKIDELKKDPGKLAKAYLDLESVMGKQGTELGQTRKDSAEYRALLHQIETNPKEVIRKIKEMTSKDEDVTAVLNQALEGDPKALSQFIDSRVSQAVEKLQTGQDLETDLVKTYPDYEQAKPAMESARIAIEAGQIPPQEALYWMVKGYHQKDMLKDAKKIVKSEQEQALVEKAQGLIDKGQVVAGEKEPPKDEDIVFDAMKKARR